MRVSKLSLLVKLCFVVLLMSVIFFKPLPGLSVQVDAATTRYVANTGNDVGDCSSAALPCRTLQYTVNQAASGDTILVAQGTYTYDGSVNNPCPPWTNAVICFVNKDLTILGGYSASNWAAANSSPNLTVIDGQNAHRGVVAVGYNTSNAYFLTMQRFTIQNGRATHGPAPFETSGIGGGMLVQHAAVILKDMVFKDNQAIGQNTSSGDGGAADGAGLRIESSPAGTASLLQRVVFDNNQSYGGTGHDRGGVAFGALFVYASSAVVEDAEFTNNLAQAGNSSGSGTSKKDGLRSDALGGGISLASGALTLRRVTVTGNQTRGGNASGVGGGAYGAGIFAEGVSPFTSQITISDVYVANNTATAGNALTGGNATGGGIGITDSLVIIERVEVLSNSAIGGNSTGSGNAGIGAGGGLYLAASRSQIPRATITNAVVTDNLATQGSGVTSAGNGSGGGIVVQGLGTDIIHATVARNRLNAPLILGQGLMLLKTPLSSGSLWASVNLNYSVIADHTEGGAQATAIVVNPGNTLTFGHGLFAGNNKDTNADNSPVPAGTINGLGTMLSAPSVGFVSPGSPQYNYHLRLDAAAKDQAMGSALGDDTDGQIRPYSTSSDLGADEHWPFSLAVLPEDGSLHLDWTVGAGAFVGGINHYELLVTCVGGGSPPEQGDCGQPINTGTATKLTLTGLSNFKEYILMINGYDASQTLIATSVSVTTFPTNLVYYVPVVAK